MENQGLRAFLAVLLSMAILFGSQYLYTKYYNPKSTICSSPKLNFLR